MTEPAGCATDLLDAIATIGEAAEVATGAWGRLTRGQMEEAYRELERARKKLAIVDAEFMQALLVHRPNDGRGVGWMFAEAANTSRAEGRQRAAAYRRLAEGEASPSGTPTNPEFMPAVREKVRDGVVGADAVEKIDRAIRSMPTSIQEELTEKADPHIAELVEKVRVDDLDKLGAMLRALFGIDDPYTDEDRKGRRSIRIGKQRYDGMSTIQGHLTPHLAALFKRLAADHGRPGGLLGDGAGADPRCPSQRLHDAVEAALAAGFGRGADPTGGEGWGSDLGSASGQSAEGATGGKTEAECGDTGRSKTECGDADGDPFVPPTVVDPSFGANADTSFDHLMDEAEEEADGREAEGREAGERETDGGAERPDGTDSRPPRERAAGPPRKRKRGRLSPARGTTSIVVVTTLPELLALNGTASTDTNVQMTVADAVEHCDARNMFLQVLDFKGQSLYLGRSNRYGDMSQYLALFGEEGMCSAPFSSAPAASCHIHHVTGWNHGGSSDLSNLTLVDPGTHANTDDSRTNPDKWWSRPGVGPEEPRVVWQPPSSVDPHRRPAHNEHPAAWCNPGRTMRRRARFRAAAPDGDPSSSSGSPDAS